MKKAFLIASLAAAVSGAALLSSLSHLEFQPLRLRTQEVFQLHHAADLPHFLLRRVRLGKAQVVRHGAGEDIGILGHDADLFPVFLHGDALHIPAVHENAPLVGVEEAHQQPG